MQSISAIFSGQVLNRKIFPWMHSKGYEFPVGHKLAVAGFFYALGYLIFCIIDLQIHRVWNESQEQISIWWQVFALLPIGVAVIMTVPTLDGFVFILSPTEFKTLGNAINKLVQVALANQIVKSLYKVCEPWFENKLGVSSVTFAQFVSCIICLLISFLYSLPYSFRGLTLATQSSMSRHKFGSSSSLWLVGAPYSLY
jgi:dipeptide/tripeptide permease